MPLLASQHCVRSNIIYYELLLFVYLLMSSEMKQTLSEGAQCNCRGANAVHVVCSLEATLVLSLREVMMTATAADTNPQ